MSTFSAVGVLKAGTVCHVGSLDGEVFVPDTDVADAVCVDRCDDRDVFELPNGTRLFVLDLLNGTR